MCRGTHLCQFGIATHHGAVGTTVSVLILEKERSGKGFPLSSHLIVLVDGVVGIGGRVFHTFGDVIDKVLGGILHGYIFRIAIHTAHITMYHTALVMREVLEGNARHTGKLLCRIITAKG